MATKNHLHKIQKTSPSKQINDTLKLNMGTNPHPKADGSTTPIEKNPIKPQKKQEKEHEQSSTSNPKKPTIKARERHPKTPSVH